MNCMYICTVCMYDFNESVLCSSYVCMYTVHLIMCRNSMCVCLCVYVCMFLCIYVCMYVCVWVYWVDGNKCMYVCMYVRMYAVR